MSKEFTGRKAMGAIGSPVVLISAAHEGIYGVMTINMIAGLSFSPVLVGISLSHRSHTRSLIERSREFAINAISPTNVELAKSIGRTTGNAIDKFKEFEIETFSGKATSCPLITIAHTIMECRVEDTVDLGRQSLYVAKVVAYHEQEKADPLYLYHGHYYAIGDKIGSF